MGVTLRLAASPTPRLGRAIEFRLRLILISVLFSLAMAGVGVIRRGFLAVTVQGLSMYPTLLPHDRVLGLRFGAHKLCRLGSIVVALAPGMQRRQGSYVLKRVVAIGANEFLLPADMPSPAERPPPAQRIKLAPDTVYLLGDNPRSSVDSRIWGPIPISAVEAVVVLRLPSRGRGEEGYLEWSATTR